MDCSPLTAVKRITQCAECPNGTFQAGYNEQKQCSNCTECDAGTSGIYGNASHAPPICCVHENVVLSMFISEKLCCSCLYQKLCCSCLYQKLCCSCWYQKLCCSCLYQKLCTLRLCSSVTVVIDRSRSEGEQVVFIKISRSVWAPGWILLHWLWRRRM